MDEEEGEGEGEGGEKGGEEEGEGKGEAQPRHTPAPSPRFTSDLVSLRVLCDNEEEEGEEGGEGAQEGAAYALVVRVVCGFQGGVLEGGSSTSLEYDYSDDTFCSPEASAIDGGRDGGGGV